MVVGVGLDIHRFQIAPSTGAVALHLELQSSIRARQQQWDMTDPAASHGKVGQDSLACGRLDFQRIIILQRTLMHADSHLDIFDQFVAHRLPVCIAIAAEARNQFTITAPIIVYMLGW